jgi:kynureninase
MTEQEQIEALDRDDPLAAKRDEFVLPEHTVYLDGNSLGCLTIAARERAHEVVETQWGRDLIKSWNQHGWIDLPVRIGEKIARLIGAAPGQTICCDSTSVNLFKLLSVALQMQSERCIILSQKDNFPSDIYMAEGLRHLLGDNRVQLSLCEEDEIETAMHDKVAVLMLTQVNFRTGRLLNMQRLTERAHALGILVIWDLAHSAGVLPVELDACRVDFAVGCGYKYLNGGPGAPAFAYVAQRHLKHLHQPLSGWMGHSSPFQFDAYYTPAPDISQLLAGTPPVISMSVLDAALEVYRDIDTAQLRRKANALSELFRTLVQRSPELQDLQLVSPTLPQQRGAQLAYRHPQAYEICQALIAHRVIADFRAPDLLRVGFSPLPLRFIDISTSVTILTKIMRSESWRHPQFNSRSKVT